jgi:hypothetical protein
VRLSRLPPGAPIRRAHKEQKLPSRHQFARANGWVHRTNSRRQPSKASRWRLFGKRAAGQQHQPASRSGPRAGGHGVTLYSLGCQMSC